jgi:hypothetical protein
MVNEMYLTRVCALSPPSIVTLPFIFRALKPRPQSVFVCKTKILGSFGIQSALKLGLAPKYVGNSVSKLQIQVAT